MHPIVNFIGEGCVLYFCVQPQIRYFLDAIWFAHVYETFGLLCNICAVVAVIMAEFTVLLCYFDLRSEQYWWRWRAFCSAGSVAFYVFGYCCYYFNNYSQINDAPSTVLYFGYAAIFAFLMFTLAGMIGFVACFCFLRVIYGAISRSRDPHAVSTIFLN